MGEWFYVTRPTIIITPDNKNDAGPYLVVHASTDPEFQPGEVCLTTHEPGLHYAAFYQGEWTATHSVMWVGAIGGTPLDWPDEHTQAKRIDPKEVILGLVTLDGVRPKKGTVFVRYDHHDGKRGELFVTESWKERDSAPRLLAVNPQTEYEIEGKRIEPGMKVIVAEGLRGPKIMDDIYPYPESAILGALGE